MFQAMSAKEIEKAYEVITNVKQVTRWVSAIAEVFPNETLKIGTGNRVKYSPFCVQKIDEIAKYYAQSKVIGDWKNDQLIIKQTLKATEEISVYPSELVDENESNSSAIAPINHHEIPVTGKLALPALPKVNYNSSALAASNAQNVQQVNQWFGQLQATLVNNAEAMGNALGGSIVQAALNGAAPQLSQLANLMNQAGQPQQNSESK